MVAETGKLRRRIILIGVGNTVNVREKVEMSRLVL